MLLCLDMHLRPSFVQSTDGPIRYRNPVPQAQASLLATCTTIIDNLLPLAGKASLLKESHRVLKPDRCKETASGGCPQAYVSCISGAIEVEVYKNILSDAGFQDAVFVDTRGDINVVLRQNQLSRDARRQRERLLLRQF